MKKILIIILSVLILSGCSSSQKIDQKIADTDNQSEDLFAKKKECASFKDKIMEDILTPNLVYDDSDPELTEIFYSPKRNSCLYIFDYYKSPDCLKMDTDTYFKVGCQFKESQIIDFLTKETVYYSITYNNCLERELKNKNTDISICKTISEKADELKKLNQD
jgi:hypothetical protein